MAHKMAHLDFQVFFLFILISVISGCRVGSPVTVSAFKEEDVVLSCWNSNVTDPKSCHRVKLIKYATGTNRMKVIFEWPKRTQDAQRVKWEADGNGQVCLSLSKLQEPDGGLYSWEIWQGWDCLQVKNISLRVKGCKTFTVKAALKTPVRLHCPVNITLAQPGPQNISWAMLKGTNPVSVDSERIEINGTSLTIQSVNTHDISWYRCNYLLGQTLHCFDIHLLVQVESVSKTTGVPIIATKTQQVTASESVWTNRKEESSGTLIAVVTSVVFGIIVIAALFRLYTYCRRNTHRVTQQFQRHTAEFNDTYEDVNLASPQDSANQRVNSLYHNIDESMLSFQC